MDGERDPDAIAALDAALHKSDKGTVLGTVSNLILILLRDPALGGLCGYDEFSCLPMLRMPPPLVEDSSRALPGPYPRVWQDVDVTHVQSYVQRVWARRVARGEVEEAMAVAAMQSRFHPVRNWLDALRWDGKPRLDTWLTKAFGAPADDYHMAVGAKFLIGACRRVRRPGCKFDYMLVLEGLQGLGKSTAMQRLFGEAWFTDALPAALESRDASLGLQGMWLIEFAEIEQLIRSEIEVIKSFISRKVDRFRAPYARQFVEHPRQCVLVGTTNATDYLRDASGNRRFWPVACEFADLEWIDANREQLFAEAALRERSGEALWLHESSLAAAAVQQQESRIQDDPWEEAVLAAIAHRFVVTVPELLLETLGIPRERQGKREQMRLGAILRRDGWLRKTEWSPGIGKVQKLWRRST